MMDKETRMKALDAALTQIEKAYGKGAVMKLGNTATHRFTEPGSGAGPRRRAEGQSYRDLRPGVFR